MVAAVGNARTNPDVVDDLMAPSTMQDPHSYFAWLRETDPVHWDAGVRAWVVTSYDGVATGLRDPRLSSRRATSYLGGADPDGQEDAFAVLSEWMGFKDPPDHTRLRKLIAKAFALRSISTLRPRVEALVDELLDDVAAAASPFDYMTVVAGPLPALVIAEMLGIPRDDRLSFQRWSEELASLVLGSPGAGPRLDRARAGLTELIAYFETLVERYRRNPGENLISHLIHTTDSGEALTREEVLGTCSLVLFAGHETTSDWLGNATLALIEHPEQRAAMVAAGTLDRCGVEEFLRYEGPSKIQSRTATEDIEMGGVQIKGGQRVLLAMASGNRDAARFPDPDRLDLTRTDTSHLGFGYGLHYCLGAALSRLEAEVLLPRQFTRFPNLRLAGDDLHWKPRVITRGLSELPLSR